MSGPRIRTYSTEEKWLAARRHRITSSDAPIIAGATRGRPSMPDVFSLWCAKTGKIPPRPRSLRFAAGHALEPVMFGELARLRPSLEIHDPGDFHLVEDPRDRWRVATLDRQFPAPPKHRAGIIEGKTAEWNMRHLWESGPDLYSFFQVQHAMSCARADHALVVVMLGLASRLDVHEVAFSPAVDDELKELEYRFRVLVDTDTPPPVGGLQSRAAVESLFPRPSNAVTVDLFGADVVEAVDHRTNALEHKDRLRAELKIVEDDIAEAENVIKLAIGEAEGGFVPEKGSRFTWNVERRKSYTVKESSSRRLRERKG